jgi:hypothetical protein
VCLFNFDRQCNPPVPGISLQFQSDIKEALFRVLKESAHAEQGIDLCLYTRGGDVNAVWPIVSLLREFDQNFQVLMPFPCHSGGTLVALGAKKIHSVLQISLSTADDEANYFTGNPSPPVKPDPNRLLPAGTYRVLDGQLYRVVPGVSPRHSHPQAVAIKNC